MVDYVNSESVSPANGTDDREAYSKCWIAVYTRPRAEKALSNQLSKFGIETYVASQKQMRQWSDRKKIVDVVVIPSVVFIKVEGFQINTVLHSPNVIRIIHNPGERKAALIPDEQINKLKFVLGQIEYPVSFDSNIISVKDTVRVVRGSLMGIVGQVEDCLNGSTELIIRIDLLGGARVKMNRSEMELIKSYV